MTLTLLRQAITRAPALMPLALIGCLIGCGSKGGAGTEHPAHAPAHEHSEGGGAHAQAQEGEAKPSPDELVAAEMAAFENARPIFEAYCAGCHTTAGKGSSPGTLKHFAMDAYPFTGHHAAELGTTIPKVLGVGGEASMPKNNPGVIQGEELEILLTWARAFAASHASAAGQHGQHHH